MVKKNLKVLTNQNIPNGLIRLLNYSDNNVIGIIERDKAIEQAKEKGLDLICKHIGDMPICYIYDISKYIFQQNKNQKVVAKMQNKQIKLGSKIQINDFKRNVIQGIKFLLQKHQVTYTIQLRSRIKRNEDRPQIIKRCNYMLEKIKEIMNFNNISKVSKIESLSLEILRGYVVIMPVSNTQINQINDIDSFIDENFVIEIPEYTNKK